MRPSDYVRVAAFEMAKRIGMNETSNKPASYCSLHVARGPWLERIPGLDKATRPENIIASISHKCPPLSNLYLSTNEEDLKIFDPLRDVYNLTIMWYACGVCRTALCLLQVRDEHRDVTDLMLETGVMNTSDGTIDKAYTVDKFRKFMVREGSPAVIVVVTCCSQIDRELLLGGKPYMVRVGCVLLCGHITRRSLNTAHVLHALPWASAWM